MGDKSSLVQPEGVNAGSAEELADGQPAGEQDAAPDGDVRGGGRPDREPKDPKPAAADVDPSSDEGPELVGTTETGPAGSSGQDAGNQ